MAFSYQDVTGNESSEQGNRSERGNDVPGPAHSTPRMNINGQQRASINTFYLLLAVYGSMMIIGTILKIVFKA